MEGGDKTNGVIPTGQPESLWGRINVSEMGSRMSRERPTTSAVGAVPSSGVKARKGILEAANELAGIHYRPLTKETGQAWEFLLALVMSYVGSDQPRDVVHSAADDALALLKDDSLRELERKEHLEDLLATAMDTDRFSQFVNLAKRITDYSPRDGKAKQKEEDHMAQGESDEEVAVVFEEDETEDVPSNVIQEEEEEEEEEVIVTKEEAGETKNHESSNADDLKVIDLEMLAFPQGISLFNYVRSFSSSFRV